MAVSIIEDLKGEGDGYVAETRAGRIIRLFHVQAFTVRGADGDLRYGYVAEVGIPNPVIIKDKLGMADVAHVKFVVRDGRAVALEVTNPLADMINSPSQGAGMRLHVMLKKAAGRAARYMLRT